MQSTGPWRHIIGPSQDEPVPFFYTNLRQLDPRNREQMQELEVQGVAGTRIIFIYEYVYPNDGQYCSEVLVEYAPLGMGSEVRTQTAHGCPIPLIQGFPMPSSVRWPMRRGQKFVFCQRAREPADLECDSYPLTCIQSVVETERGIYINHYRLSKEDGGLEECSTCLPVTPGGRPEAVANMCSITYKKFKYAAIPEPVVEVRPRQGRR